MKEPLAFAVDRMLGRLCKWMRILGFDSRYVSVDSRKQIEDFRKDGRMVLTRNQRWRNVEGVFFISTDHPMEQVKQVTTALKIHRGHTAPFKICIRCNNPLKAVPKEGVLGLVPEHIHFTMKTFHMCSECKNVYWCGSHPRRMTQHMEQIFGQQIFNANSKEG